MSTRGLIGFVHKGDVKAFYNHFDSYLSGQGQFIVNFCESVDNWNEFIQQYENVLWTDKQLTKLPNPPHGAEMLYAILEGQVVSLCNDIDFASDKLSCDYAYLLNLDSKQFEIYSNHLDSEIEDSDQNLPMNLIAAFPLTNIPENWQDIISLKNYRADMDWIAQQNRDLGMSDGLEL